MSERIDRSWTVLVSVENDQHDRCVDLFRRPDDSFGFEEFRRDPEDAGRWTPVAWYVDGRFETREAAWASAVSNIAWLDGGDCC